MFDKFLRQFREAIPRSSPPTQNSLRSYVSHFGLGALALILSLSLWILITMEQNPPRSDTFPLSIPVKPVNVPPSLDVLGEIQPVRVRISAPLDTWNRLGANDFKATVDLARSNAGTQEFTVQAEAKSGRVTILEVIPAKIPVRLEMLSQQVVPVRVNIVDNPPIGYMAGEYEITPKQVAIIGPEQLVNQVDAAVANVDLSGMKVMVNQSFRLSPRTARGYEVVGVTLEPASAVVKVPIKQQLHQRNFILSPTLKGSVAPGYYITNTSIEPATVSVIGPLEVLQGIEFLHTMPVDVEGATQTVTQTVGVDIPQGASIVEATKVTTRVTVVPKTGSQIFQVAPQFIGTTYGRRVTADADNVDVTLYGDMPVLINLKPTEIRVVLDVSGLAPGSYVLEPKVVVFQPLEVLDFSPKGIRVTIG